MFTLEDLKILQCPGSWEKIAAIQENLFPKLGALQVKANKLIYEIYKIDVNETYKISETPTFSSRKGQVYNAERRGNNNYALVGLRAKGKPSHLTNSQGKLCEMHFALLAFSIDVFEDDCELSCFFSPNVLKYASIHLLDFSRAVILHDLDVLVTQVQIVETADFYRLSHDLDFFDLFQEHRAWLSMNNVKLLEATRQDLAQLVISYAAFFPMLDLFTRVSNGEECYLEREGELIPADNPNYFKLFERWQNETIQDYLDDFFVEPITQEEVWKSESLTRSIFEELLDEKFPKTRPSWLKSGNHQASLELDGYCEKLRLAFEYQGEYHYIEIPIHHQSRSLKEVQKNDELKLSLCQRHGVDLIQVPYWEKGNREYIVKALKALERPDIQKILEF